MFVRLIAEIISCEPIDVRVKSSRPKDIVIGSTILEYIQRDQHNPFSTKKGQEDCELDTYFGDIRHFGHGQKYR